MTRDELPKRLANAGGIFNGLSLRIRLIGRLMMDKRVNPFLKLLPIGSIVYFIFPDLLPGPIDDVAVMWLATYLFVELCPPEVVKEHMEALNRVVPGEVHDPLEAEDNVVDGEFKDLDQ